MFVDTNLSAVSTWMTYFVRLRWVISLLGGFAR